MGQFFIPCSRIRVHRVQQEYNSLLANALNRIFKSNLSLNNFKWLLTKLELSCVRNIIPRSRKRLWNGYPALNQELQNHDPGGRHIQVMYGSTPPPPGGKTKKVGLETGVSSRLVLHNKSVGKCSRQSQCQWVFSMTREWWAQIDMQIKLQGSWHVISGAHLAEKVLHNKCQSGDQFEKAVEPWVNVFQRISQWTL